jgi:hypothetical protein
MVVAAPVETSKPRDYYIPLQYPADAANYLWQLQQSTNHTNWVTIGPTNGYQVGTNFYWYGGPVSNWDYTVTVPKAKTYFWRLIGTSKY